MKIRTSAIGIVVAAQAMVLTAPTAFADATDAQRTQQASEEKLSLARQAIRWSKDRLSEADASIAVLEQHAAKLQGDAKAKADAALQSLRDKRDAYRKQAQEAVEDAKTWTDAQVDTARKSLDEHWDAFQSATNDYLETRKADLETRKAVLEADIEARQKAWEKWIEDLRKQSEKVAQEKRAQIDAQIAALKSKVDEERARADRLKDASRESWKKAQKGYADAQKVIADTYGSIRQSIEDALK
ncbi:hypothetical protein [Hyphomicrobium sp. DY-1]|uniref:hypothetical protein n=1 Tax=Hyphomicrobium sp. DY-1 TaxID=3075650 RepID=UPI0039C197F5